MTQQRGMRASSLLLYKADLLLASDAMAAAVAACTGSSEVALPAAASNSQGQGPLQSCLTHPAAAPADSCWGPSLGSSSSWDSSWPPWGASLPPWGS